MKGIKSKSTRKGYSERERRVDKLHLLSAAGRGKIHERELTKF